MLQDGAFLAASGGATLAACTAGTGEEVQSDSSDDDVEDQQENDAKQPKDVSMMTAAAGMKPDVDGWVTVQRSRNKPKC